VRRGHDFKYTTEFCIDLANERGGKFLSKKYLGYSKQHLWKCKDPDHPPFLSYFFNVIRRNSWCASCRHSEGSRRAFGISDTEWKKRSLKVGLKVLNVLRKIGTKPNLEVQCLKNPKHIYIKAADNVKAGTGCKYCNKMHKLTLEDAQKLATKKRGSCLSKKYINANSKLLWQCQFKHKPWPATYGDVRGSGKRLGTWCPECSGSNGERICRTFFEQLFNKDFPTKKPQWLKPKGWMQPMQLDGYCEELKLAFEHHGQYHYKKIKFFDGGNTRLSVQERDKIKRQLCKKNGITLIEIKEVPFLQPIETLKQLIKKSCQKNKVSLPKNFNSIVVDIKKADIHPDWMNEFNAQCKQRGFTPLAEEYKGSQIAYPVKCNTCGYKWPIKKGNLKLGRGCMECYKKRRGIK